MIEINNHNGTWECWVGGRIWEWNDDLKVLLSTLAKSAEELIEDMED